MRRRLAGLSGALCGLCLLIGCTSDAVDPVGQDRVFGPQPEESAKGDETPGQSPLQLAVSSAWPDSATPRSI